MSESVGTHSGGSARALTPKLRRIALLTSPYAFMQQLNRGVVACARRMGPWCVEAYYYGSGDSFGSYLVREGYDGVVSTITSPDLDVIAEAGIPVVMAMIRHKPSPPVPSETKRGGRSGPSGVQQVTTPPAGLPTVLVDDEEVGVLAAEHLIECGYRRFAFYGVPAGWSDRRLEGFSRTLRARGMPLVTNGQNGRWLTDSSSGRSAELRKFLLSLERPVAMLACNDGHGRRIADFAAELGLRVPGELAVLGVDNDELACDTGVIPLSSVDPDLYRVGFEAALRLEEILRGEPATETLMIKPKGVVRRESTSLFIHDDPDVAAALRFLYQHACDGITVEDVCGHVVLSRRRFEQRFRAAVGRPPGEEIRRLRMERAKALLSETQMSLAEITRRCGYGHTPALTTAFRRLVGQSPSEYRRAAQSGPRPAE